jgi:hypothetical protein
LTWLDSTLEQVSSAIEVDVTGLGLTQTDGKPLTVLMAKPLSAAEYQVLKSEPEIRHLSGDDRTEMLGLRMTFEMLAKCDDSLKWKAFKSLPLQMIAQIAASVSAAVGTPSPNGGGVLGEL